MSDITLVAQEWGGPIGLAAVEERPTAVDSLVLANTWAWPITGAQVSIVSHLLGGPVGRVLIRQFNLFVNALIPAGHRLRKPTANDMDHYRTALATHDRRHASVVLPGASPAAMPFSPMLKQDWTTSLHSRR